MKLTAQTIPSKPPVLYLLLLSMLVALVYFKLFSAGFISWDDGDVLLNNKDVHQFNIGAFFTKYYVGNYAPLTMIGFAIDWMIFHGKAVGHHAISIVFHVVNGLLVYYLSHLLLKDKLKAIVCTAIFCFHPLQVETVAWVSAKNNLLYSQFFLLGLICYAKYLTQDLKKYYSYTLVFFILSVLCKPSAICFPLCLPLLDYVLKEKTTLKVFILNKIPFLIIALILGIATIYTRTEDKFINENHAFAFHERVGYAGYAILQYIYHFFIPVNLSVIYPYPQNKGLSLITGYIVLAVCLFACYKLYRSRRKLLLFGVLFFVANLVLVLQFLPFGEVLTADRYMYLPILGLSWAIVSAISVKEKQLTFISLAIVIVFGTLTFFRASVWQNSISLYSDIIKKYPHSFVALNSLGAEHMLNKNYDLSLRYLNSAILENTSYYKGYYNRGLLYAQTNRMNDALADFTKAIELNKYPKAYVGRANVYYLLNDYSRAMADANEVLKTDPKNSKANFTLANCYDDKNDLNNAMYFYNTAISSNTNDASYYLRRAIVHGKMKQLNSSLDDLNTATTLNPSYAEAYYWKGVVKVNLKQNPCEDFKRAVDLGFNAAGASLNTYCR